MSWTEGLAPCSPLSSTCVLDWSVIATTLAVAAAWITIVVNSRNRRKAARESLRQQTAEMLRQESQRLSTARRLAKIFDRELYQASVELVALRKLLGQIQPNNVHQFRVVYAMPLAPNVFSMHERFVGNLDVFPDELAIAIVNNLTNWKNIPVFSTGVPEIPDRDLLHMRPKMVMHVTELLAEIDKTKQKLLPYFADLPNLEMKSMEEVRKANEAAVAAMVQASKRANGADQASGPE